MDCFAKVHAEMPNYPTFLFPKFGRLGFFGFLFVLLLSGTQYGSGFPMARPHPSVVRVVGSDSGQLSLGSGTLIEVHGPYGVVVTNWHVVRDAVDGVGVVFPDGFRSAARILKLDRNWDLAALLIWRPRSRPVAVSLTAAQIGEPLTIAGYGSRGQYRSVTGRCTQYVAPCLKCPFEMLEVSVKARKGDSGGPIFNEQGELAGVLFGTSQNGTSGSYAGRLRWFLEPVLAQLGSSPQPFSEDEPPLVVRRLDKAMPTEDDVVKSPILARVSDASPKQSTTAPVALSQQHKSRAAVNESKNMQPVASWPKSGQLQEPKPKVVHEPIPWSTLVGRSIPERAKTVLAVVGVFSLLVHGLRFFESR